MEAGMGGRRFCGVVGGRRFRGAVGGRRFRGVVGGRRFRGVAGGRRYRGVVSVSKRVGTWGARISKNYKNFWLGTFPTRNEAVVAHDRAAMKLKRRETDLNLPRRNGLAVEKLFQDLHSERAILQMIKNKSYSAVLADFISSSFNIDINKEIHIGEGSGTVKLMLFGVQIG